MLVVSDVRFVHVPPHVCMEDAVSYQAVTTAIIGGVARGIGHYGIAQSANRHVTARQKPTGAREKIQMCSIPVTFARSASINGNHCIKDLFYAVLN